MNIRLFYNTVSSDETVAKVNFLQNFIEELALGQINVELIEQKEIGYLKTNFYREGNLVSYNAHKISNFPEFEEGDIIVLDGTLNETLLVKVISEKPKNSKLILHDYSKEVHFSEEFLWNGFDGLIVNCLNPGEDYLSKFDLNEVLTFSEAINSRLFYPGSIKDPKEGLLFIGNNNGYLDESIIINLLGSCDKAGIFGKGYSGQVIEELKHAGVNFLGDINLSKLAKVLRHFQVAIVAPQTRHEKESGKVPANMLYALASGIPVISLDYNEAWRYIRPGKEFFFCENLVSLEQAISLILNDKAKCSELIRNGLRVVNSHYTFWHRVNQFLHFCSVLKKKSIVKSLV